MLSEYNAIIIDEAHERSLNIDFLLGYAYTPGEEQDGVTVKLGFTLAQTVSQASVEWAVPGLREGQISELLRALPKSIRRELMPFPPKVAEIARDLQPTGDSLKQDLAAFIRKKYGVEIPPNAWPVDAVPQHLRPRVEVIGPDQKSLGASRDLGELRKKLEKTKVKPVAADSAWTRLALKWERFGLSSWSFGDLPERIGVSEVGPVPIFAWLGLQVDESTVSVRLFRSQDAARLASLGGIHRLIELALQKDFAWLQKDLRALAQFAALTNGLCSMEELQNSAFENLKRHVLPREVFPILTEANFRVAVEQTRNQIPGLATQLIERVGVILKLRQEVLRRAGPSVAPAPAHRTMSDLSQLSIVSAPKRPANAWLENLESLLPGKFLETISFTRLAQVPRYLKALLTRIERAALNPLKDQERARQLAPYLEALKKHGATPAKSREGHERLEEFRWMVEEFKVSLFAQELGTAFSISAQKLDQQLQRI